MKCWRCEPGRGRDTPMYVDVLYHLWLLSMCINSCEHTFGTRAKSREKTKGI